jgi:hypothetical protein
MGTVQHRSYSEVSKFDYLLTDPLLRYVADVEEYENRSPRLFELVEYLGTGCVFGVRGANREWRCYLQANVSVYYRPGRAAPRVWANRTLWLSEIFPNKSVMGLNVPKPLP